MNSDTGLTGCCLLKGLSGLVISVSDLQLPLGFGLELSSATLGLMLDVSASGLGLVDSVLGQALLDLALKAQGQSAPVVWLPWLVGPSPIH